MDSLGNGHPIPNETYRQQLGRLAKAMAVPNQQHVVAPHLEPGTPLHRVKMFVDGNLDKRLEKLVGELSFVSKAFDDLESLVIRYMQTHSLEAFDTSATDAERLLSWISSTQDLTPVQQDYLSCHSARQTVEQTARRRRVEHIRFYGMRNLNDHLVAELRNKDDVHLHLNPVRVWSRFTTTVLLDGSAPPADVMFFALGNEIVSAVFESRGSNLLSELTYYEPCSLETWGILSRIADRDEIENVVRELVDLGLVALG